METPWTLSIFYTISCRAGCSRKIHAIAARSNYDENGAPSFISHRMLFDLDEDIGMMNFAEIDAAMTSALVAKR